MKYEIYRAWDASRFAGIGFVGYLEREKIEKGECLIPRENEFKDDLQRELLTGKVNCVLKRGEYKYPKPDSEARVGLEEVVNVSELAKKYNISEDKILDDYLHLSSPGRKKVAAMCQGGLLLLDDFYSTEDRGLVGIIWRARGDFIVYEFETGDIIDKRWFNLGARYGNCGKRDFLRTIQDIEDRNKELKLSDIFTAIKSIRDYDYYHYEDD